MGSGCKTKHKHQLELCLRKIITEIGEKLRCGNGSLNWVAHVGIYAARYLLYSKIGAIAWRHPAIPVRHLIPCQIINFCESAYEPTTTSDIIPVNCEAVKLYTKRLY